MRQLSSPLFVGRARELQLLRTAWDAARRHRPAVIIVGGDAGVGKTRLVGELATRCREDGQVLVGTCADFGEGGLPLGAIIEALRPLARKLPPAQLSGLVGPARVELARLFPELIPEGGGFAPAPPDEFARARLFELLLGLLDRLSGDRPTLLVLEDLHWADASTRDFLAFLARNVREERLLVVGTYRSDELHRRHALRPYLAELERSGRIERLELLPFEPSELRSLLHAILGDDPGAGLTERVFQRSEGNAFFTEELLAAGGREWDGAVPPTVQAILTARLEALSSPALQIARIAAVAGRRVDEELLAAVAGVGEEELLDALREAVAQQILVPQRDVPGGQYAFRHALLQEAVYADLLPGERRQIHRSVAAVLAASREPGTPGDDEILPRLAHHWYHARDLSRAFAASVEAGLAANAAFGFLEALTYLERALELWSAVEDRPAPAAMDRVELLWQAARAALGAGEIARAATLLRSAIADVDARREPLRVASLYGHLMISLVQTGDSRAADAAIAEALRLTSVEPGTKERAQTLMLAGVQLALDSRHREALPMLVEARDLATRLGVTDEEFPSPSRLSTTLGTLAPIALCTGYVGDVDEAVRLLREERRLASQRHKIGNLVDSYIVEALVLEAAGRFDEAVALVEDALVEIRRLGLERSLSSTLSMTAAEALRHLGRWPEADRISREITRDFVPRAEGGWEIGGAHAARALLLVAMGRMEEAEQESAAASAAFPGAEGRRIGFSGQYFSERAESALYRAEPAQALEAVVDGLRSIERSDDMRWIGHLSALGLRAEADLAEVARSRRDEEQLASALQIGARLWEQVRAKARKSVEEGTIFRREIGGHLALGEAEFARLSGRSDPTLWSAAAKSWKELQEPYPVAYALYRQAEAALRNSRSRAEPVRLLREARAITQRLGAEPLRSQIESLARRAGVDIAGHEEPAMPQADQPAVAAALDTYGLTPREHEVLEMLAAGRSDREIAEALYISPKTVSVHVSNIKGKLAVDHRVEAATIAIRLGVARDDARG